MKVIATKKGYHGKLREPGDEFDVPKGSKASWFEPVKQPPAKGESGGSAEAGEDAENGAGSQA